MHPTENVRATSPARRLAPTVPGSPRLLMAVIVTIAGTGGFLLSAALLRAGLSTMWARYVVAVLFAWALLALLLRWWLARRRRETLQLEGERDTSWLDGADVAGDVLRSVRGSPPAWTGGGGSFQGGGATVQLESGAPWTAGGGEAAGGAAGLALDVDADAVPFLAAIALVLVALGAAFAAGWIVYAAPELFAELLLDGVVSGAVYRRLRSDAGRPGGAACSGPPGPRRS
jgi:hypothetical protein